MKYDFKLDMSNDNSNSLILREIKPNSTVLEFGPAHGRMTKYLKENLNCKVSIVEINDDAGNHASSFAEYYLLGPEKGNIENFKWLMEFPKKYYDYIIFADVLEHLYNPYMVLKEAVNLLKDNGSIIISIPNVSHNSVIIDLINNNFQYRELGLLDNTHIRFFTSLTLTKMVSDAGLKVFKKMDSHCAVEHTELKNNFSMVSPFIEIELRKRIDGDIYQFIWELKL